MKKHNNNKLPVETTPLLIPDEQVSESSSSFSSSFSSSSSSFSSSLGYSSASNSSSNGSDSGDDELAFFTQNDSLGDPDDSFPASEKIGVEDHRVALFDEMTSKNPNRNKILDLINKVDVNITNVRGQTFLMVAAAHGLADAVDALIARGAYLDQKNNDESALSGEDDTAFAAACAAGYWIVAKKLALAGADPTMGIFDTTPDLEFLQSPEIQKARAKRCYEALWSGAIEGQKVTHALIREKFFHGPNRLKKGAVKDYILSLLPSLGTAQQTQILAYATATLPAGNSYLQKKCGANLLADHLIEHGGFNELEKKKKTLNSASSPAGNNNGESGSPPGNLSQRF